MNSHVSSHENFWQTELIQLDFTRTRDSPTMTPLKPVIRYLSSEQHGFRECGVKGAGSQTKNNQNKFKLNQNKIKSAQ